MKGSARSCILDRPTDPRILRSSQKRWLAGGFFGRHLDFIEGVALPQIMALIAATFVFGAGMSLTAVGQKFLKELQESLEAEDDSKSTNASPKPIVICGPSGVGKGTLINMLLLLTKKIQIKLQKFILDCRTLMHTLLKRGHPQF